MRKENRNMLPPLKDISGTVGTTAKTLIKDEKSTDGISRQQMLFLIDGANGLTLIVALTESLFIHNDTQWPPKKKQIKTLPILKDSNKYFNNHNIYSSSNFISVNLI